LTALCPTCNADIVPVPSGYVCSSGCGRIMSKSKYRSLVAKQAREALLAARRIEGLGISRWYILGMPGIWMSGDFKADYIAAHTGERRITLRRDQSLEHAIQAALEGRAP